eukprot:TRINITY_DN122989_c0_g1_i1.p1 TRINITY_DN122989_c0_g1~~TRINITY_DN122989_c0_g1_i1.p1  ORF type:complete len:617 (+),score=102.74 TRINITY_DN122989_c0_g1_i1:94-1944(+)
MLGVAAPISNKAAASAAVASRLQAVSSTLQVQPKCRWPEPSGGALPRVPTTGVLLTGVCVVSQAIRKARRRREACKQQKQRSGVQLVAVSSDTLTATPSEYYSLLGLPVFTSSKQEIKSAYRRVAKLVHPDVLGNASVDLQAMVNEAYNTLVDDNQRAAYDATLRLSTKRLTTSKWARNVPMREKALFVDETKCVSCESCTTSTGDSVGRHQDNPLREGKAYMKVQYADPENELAAMPLVCPPRAVKFEASAEVPLLEVAMEKSMSLQQRRDAPAPGPYDLIQAARRKTLELIDPLSSYSGGDANKAWESMADEERRVAAGKMLSRSRAQASASGWADGMEKVDVGVFVDETKCTRCYSCTEVASSTFAVHGDERDAKAFVATQYGDSPEIVAMAVSGCPSNAISYASRSDLATLEYGMANRGKLQQLLTGPAALKDNPGPWDLLQDYMLDDIIQADIRIRERVDPWAEVETDFEVASRLSKTARAIAAATLPMPADIQTKLWSRINSSSDTDNAVGGSSEGQLTGMKRAELKIQVFQHFDVDRDGFLKCSELRQFADFSGFDGDDMDWSEEYAMICEDFGCDPSVGLERVAFSSLIDDEEGGYLSDDDMRQILCL